MHIVVTGYGPFCSKAEDKDRATQFDVNPSWAGLQSFYFNRFIDICAEEVFLLSPSSGSSEAATNNLGSKGC